MTTKQFDEALYQAARNVNFGPMNGFGGYGSDKVFSKLPKNIQELCRKWNLPTEILAGRDCGKLVRSYAEACGINIEQDLALLS